MKCQNVSWKHSGVVELEDTESNFMSTDMGAQDRDSANTSLISRDSESSFGSLVSGR